jgi:hypothetical protein
MQADMDKLVHMRLEGTMAELLVQLDPVCANNQWEVGSIC